MTADNESLMRIGLLRFDRGLIRVIKTAHSLTISKERIKTTPLKRKQKKHIHDKGKEIRKLSEERLLWKAAVDSQDIKTEEKWERTIVCYQHFVGEDEIQQPEDDNTSRLIEASQNEKCNIRGLYNLKFYVKDTENVGMPNFKCQNRSPT
ncbi:hypothetical protein CHS0354_018143 [Potamilus streckersoni]|uniref:Uncharacterized protein n=1 Tax=Potamilus streckersoni TaxID=2493646 RepID=A0AAE0SSX9_9BIVA|nr:hypothetical protein CHS0354_018143 [Potamilus streckersoni]